MPNLAWRRCPACGQLTLVPATAETCWQCGAGIAARPNLDDSGFSPASVQDSLAAGPVADQPNQPSSLFANPPAAPESNLPPRRPGLMDLTADDDVVARRLLDSVFPEGVEV